MNKFYHYFITGNYSCTVELVAEDSLVDHNLLGLATSKVASEVASGVAFTSEQAGHMLAMGRHSCTVANPLVHSCTEVAASSEEELAGRREQKSALQLAYSHQVPQRDCPNPSDQLVHLQHFGCSTSLPVYLLAQALGSLTLHETAIPADKCTPSFSLSLTSRSFPYF